MQNLRVLLTVSAAFAAVVVACGSSSSSNPVTPSTPDASDDSTTPITESDDSSAAATCVPLGSVGCSGKGMECCLDLSKGLMPGTCVAAGTCTSSVVIGCESGNDCAGGQVCCADFGGGSLAALQDGGLAALGIDASETR